MIEKVFTYQYSPELFGQFSLKIDLFNLLVFVLILLSLGSSLFSKATQTSHSRKSFLYFLIGCSLLVFANDIVLLMAGAALSSTGLIIANLRSRDESTSTERESLLNLLIIGWSFIFAGLAWLVACAAIVRSAPHGLPGISTINILELVNLIRRSAMQHPAAKMAWEQYQLVPTLAVFIGIAFLGGLVPFHTLFVKSFQAGSFVTRIWLIVIAKVSILLFHQFFVAPDPFSWETSANLFMFFILCGFVYVSYLIYSASDAVIQLGHLLAWSQQFTMLGWCFTPYASKQILWLSTVVQFAGLVLLCLVMELSSKHGGKRLLAAKLVGIMSVGGASSIAGLLLIWNLSLSISISPGLGAAAFVLFAIALLISIGGCVDYLQKPYGEESGEQIHLRFSQKAIIGSWSLVAILGSFLSLYIKALQ